MKQTKNKSIKPSAQKSRAKKTGAAAASEFEAELSERGEEIESLQSQLKKLEDDLIVKSRDIAKGQVLIEQLTAANATIRGELNALRKETKKNNRRVRELGRERSDFQAQVKRLDDLLSERDQEAQRLSQELAFSAREQGALQDSLRAKSEQAGAAHDRVAELDINLSEVQLKFEAEQQNARSLKGQLEYTFADLRTAMSNLEEQSKLGATLERRLSKTRRFTARLANEIRLIKASKSWKFIHLMRTAAPVLWRRHAREEQEQEHEQYANEAVALYVENQSISKEPEVQKFACSDEIAPLVFEEKYYMDLSTEPVFSSPVKTIAFYLPQFHRIPENDEWWGEGFTEWTKTRSSEPLFHGHHQPRTPTSLGYYNLEDVEVYAQQVNLAKRAGIYGFCFYFYWFNGKTLLEKPLRNVVTNRQIDQPFCLCWANENWTRRWDGQESDILISQEHSESDSIAFLDHVNTYFSDDRYIKIDGKPLLVVYRPVIVPDIARVQQLWRKKAKDLGWPGLYIVSAQTFGQQDPREIEFDAAVQFPPHNYHQTREISRSQETPGLINGFEGGIYDYRDMTSCFSGGVNPDYKMFRGVTLGWDNTARRREFASMWINFTLTDYAQWLSAAFKATLADPKTPENEKFVFINAWNEWGEGTYLEPDDKYGFGYLEATKQALSACIPKTPRLSVIVPNYNHASFIERRINSIIRQSRKPDEIIFLDDASNDDSVALARGILSRSNIRYTVIENAKNSGGVFRQWLKGIENATGDLIWIAESDDDAAPDFLENILPAFDREDVLLAYGNISYINPDGTPDSGLLQYYDGLEGLSWEHSHLVTANCAFTGAFAVKNIIPNVSGSVFRKPILTKHEKERLTSYTFAGDWYYYALVARGGSIAFCKEAKSYFRLNPQSTSRKEFYSQRHIAEHKMILQDLQVLYGIGQKMIQNHEEALWQVLKHHLPDTTREDLVNSLKVEVPKYRKAKICIASYGFFVGGGEIAPIDIANALRDLGHHVTFLVLEKNLPDNPPVLRTRLRSDIPVVYWENIKNRFEDFLFEQGIEIFNSHNVAIEFALYSAGVRVDVPFLASLHGSYETVPELLTADFLKYLRENVDEWLYLSEKNIEPLRKCSQSGGSFTKSFNTIVCPKKEDVKLNIRKSMNADGETVLLVLASRAIHQKGWQLAIDATRQLRCSTGRDCRLLLIGDGPDLEAIKAANANDEFVWFVGSSDNPIPIIQECDIGIFPSTYSGESFPLFLLECLQNGLPVIATDIGEIPKIMSAIEGHIPGHIVSKDQSFDAIVHEMEQALAALIKDKGTLTRARKQAHKVAAHFGLEKLTELYLGAIYRLSTAHRKNTYPIEYLGVSNVLE